MTTKLTLSVDADIVRRAKRYARAHGTSLSRMVGHFLALVSETAGEPARSPGLRRLRGVIKAGDPEDYRRHLRRKYL